MRSNSIEYDAHYQLLHDNLCDLSHVDFVHETTLKVATGADWSTSAPAHPDEKSRHPFRTLVPRRQVAERSQ